MNNTLDMIPYKPTSVTAEDDSLIATGFVALATLAVAVMQHCGSSDKTQKSEPLRIKIPPHVDSPPTTPSPPPRATTPPPAPARLKRVVADEDELDTKIVRFLRFNPGATVKEMLKTFKTKDPSLTKSDINSRLYKMLIKKILTKEGDKGVPNWFLI